MNGEQKEPPALVRNAADPEQVNKAGRKLESRRNRELNDLCAVLSQPQGRRFLWRLLGYCNVFSSIWRPSAEIHHLAGKQDCGHWIMGEIGEADEEKLFLMMREAKNSEKNE